MTEKKPTKKKNRQSPEVSPVMHALADYIAGALRKPLPRAVLQETRHHALDTIAAMVSGTRLLPGKMAVSYVKTLGGIPEAMVVGSKFATNAVNVDEMPD